MTDETPAISVVIPTWNGRALLATCLASLAGQTFRDWEIIVVDDGSTDDTRTFLAAEYPDVRVVVLEKNKGFAVAVNAGIREARGAWVFLLNNDVTLAEDCLERLAAAGESGRYAMLTPLVLWTEDPALVYSAGDRVGVHGRPESIGYMTGRADVDGRETPFGVSGGYGLFRRDLFENVGALDPAFVAYFEDSDLCFRARWAGYDAALVPEALAWHVGSASIRDRTWWRTRQCYRNHALLVLKNYTLTLVWWNRAALLRERCHQGTRLFQVARAESGAAWALGVMAVAWLDLVVHVPGALVGRWRTMKRRTRSSAAMQTLLKRGGDDA